MNCKRCNSEYTKETGVVTARRDYGYCSMSCFAADKPPCPGCGQEVIQRDGEPLYEYVTRSYCRQKCAAVALGKQKKSPETRRKMSEYAQKRPTETLEKIVANRKAFYDSPFGQEATDRTTKKVKEWRERNPDVVEEIVKRQHESRQRNGTYERTSKRLNDFFHTPEGEARKEEYRRLYTGVPRPMRVTQKMKDSLRRFWDSPQGWQMRSDISANRTNGLRSVPYGPGWNQKAARVRQRDGQCIICGCTAAESRRKLDVHHIYARRLFGYVPGENQNHLWANHSFNLVALCQSCHGRVELGAAIVPPSHQQRADDLWAEFVKQSSGETS